MRIHNEAKGVPHVEQRLLKQLPSVGPDLVRAAGTVAHGSIALPIREVVPLLVGHNARDRLTALCHGPVPLQGGRRGVLASSGAEGS